MAEWSKAPDSSSGLRKRAWVQILLLTCCFFFFFCLQATLHQDLSLLLKFSSLYMFVYYLTASNRNINLTFETVLHFYNSFMDDSVISHVKK
ncbi:hypothetical protein LINPERPRIM_LOCUS29369 [Linum perenne]